MLSVTDGCGRKVSDVRQFLEHLSEPLALGHGGRFGERHHQILHGVASMIVFVHNTFGEILGEQLLGAQFLPSRPHQFPDQVRAIPAV